MLTQSTGGKDMFATMYNPVTDVPYINLLGQRLDEVQDFEITYLASGSSLGIAPLGCVFRKHQ